MKSRSIRQLSDLTDLRNSLRQDAEERARRAREKARTEAVAKQEANIFRAAVADAVPLKAAQRAQASPPRPPPIPRQHLADESAALASSLSDDFDAETLLDTDDTLSWRRDGIGSDVVRKLRRGHWVVQDEIDLHGARRDEARELVAGFVRDSIRRGLRCIRIVHGKGLGSIDRQPVLKGKVKTWLMQKDEVLVFCQARAQDGGSGAVIVLLRPSSVEERRRG